MILRELFDTPQDTTVEFIVDTDKQRYRENYGYGRTMYWFLAGEEGQDKRWFVVAFNPVVFQEFGTLSFDVGMYREYDLPKKTSKFDRRKKLGTVRDANLMSTMTGENFASSRMTLQVWSTVIKSVMDFLNKVRPDNLVFSGATPSHVKLYDSMFKSHQDELNQIGYRPSHNPSYDWFIIKKSFMAESFSRGSLTEDEIGDLLMFVALNKDQVTPEMLATLDKALRLQPPLASKTTLYRGLRARELGDDQQLGNSRPTSFSSDEKVAWSFARKSGSNTNTMLKVEFPAGTKGILDVVSFVSSCSKEQIDDANKKAHGNVIGHPSTQSNTQMVDIVGIAKYEKEFIVSPRSYNTISTTKQGQTTVIVAKPK